MFEQYDGKYGQVPYEEVVNYLTGKLSAEDLKLWEEENRIIKNGIHMRAMNQMYYLYEQYKDNALRKGEKKYVSVTKRQST
jgi:hypothetical protein